MLKKVLQCYTVSTLLFDCETWTVNKKMSKTLEATDMVLGKDTKNTP